MDNDAKILDLINRAHNNGYKEGWSDCVKALEFWISTNEDLDRERILRGIEKSKI